MSKNQDEKRQIMSRKMLRTRNLWIVIAVTGLSLLLVLEPQLGKIHTTIQDVFGIFIGGLMLFCGGIGVAATTLFIKLEKKGKNKPW